MCHNICLIVLLSALFFVIPFIVPFYTAELIFIAFIPLLYAVHKYSLSFWHGLLWGIVVNSIFYSALFVVIIQHGYGWLRYIAIPFFLLYTSLYAGIWFYLSFLIAVRYSSIILRLCVWLFSSFWYCYFIDTGLFWIFDQYEGNSLSFPLLPLIVRPAWLWLLPIVGKYILFLFLLCSSALLVLFLITKQIKHLFLALILFSPFWLGWLVSRNVTSKPIWLDSIVTVIPSTQHTNPWECAHELSLLFERSSKKELSSSIIILPESSFPFPLHQYPVIVQSWFDYVPQSVTIIIGSHRLDQDNLYNTIYLLHEGEIITWYDKNHIFFFTERVPEWFLHIQSLFLYNKETFYPGLHECTFILPDIGEVQPFICSDLFFDKDRIQMKRCPLLCMVNDSWFNLSYARHLMYLDAQFKVFEYQRGCIYLSHTYARYIDKVGNEWTLESTN